MSEAPEHIAKTIDGLKTQLSTKLGEAKEILRTINTLEQMHGIPKTMLPDVSVTASVLDSIKLSDVGSSSNSHTPSSQTIGTIRPDEYLGKEPLEAAKQYLRRVGHAVHIDEIADAVSRGGASTQENEWKKKLETSLIRSTLDAIKIGEHVFGLRDFYAQAQIDAFMSAKRPQVEGQGKKASQKKKSAKPKKSKRESETAVKEPTPILDSTIKFLRLLIGAKEKGVLTADLARGLGYDSGRSLSFLLRGINRTLTSVKVDPKTTYEGRRVENEQRWFAGEKIEEALKLMKA